MNFHNSPNVKMKAFFPRNGQLLELGSAFQTDKGTDLILHVMPPANEAGEIIIVTRDSANARENRPHTQMKVLFARNFKLHNGEQRTQWIEVGTAVQGDCGTDLVLYLVPPPNERGEFRVLTRPADGQQRYDGYARNRAGGAPAPAVSYARQPVPQVHTTPEPPAAGPRQDDDLPF
jgi:hypothetical protein